jgi:C-terminal processing protease CtpA/Prc
MRFARLLALSLGVMAVGVGGAYMLAPAASGQAKRIVVGPSDDVRVFGLGGSRLGISIRDVDQADVTREKLAGQAGAVIEEVSSESPGAKAGLKSGDVVVSFDGERVRSARQLERLVGETPSGRSVKMTVQRGGSRLDLDVTPETSAASWMGSGDMWRAGEAARLGPRIEQDFRRRFPAMEFNWDGDATWMLRGGRGRLGVAVQDLSEQLAGYFGVKTGVLVTDVDTDSPAAKAGIKAGDVITAVNGQTVDGPDELRREVSKVDDGGAADVSVTRDKKSLSLKVTVENPERRTERRTRRTV